MLTHPDGSALFHKAREEFESGKYFECHETLEILWRSETNPDLRGSLRGLIHLAAAELHKSRANTVGQELQTAKAFALLKHAADQDPHEAFLAFSGMI